jgi:ubiquinone/menaquinone biosynthesis C-methylase UbiE
MDGDLEMVMGHKEYRKRLVDHIIYRLKFHIPKARISELIEEHKTTVGFLNAVAGEIDAVKSSPEADAARGKSRIRDLAKLDLGSPKSYLDIGCADGNTTAAVGKMFKLSKANIHGADVAGWAGREVKISDDITFHPMDDPEKIPMETASVDVVSAFMVLHHIPNLKSTLSEIRRVLKPGGIFILREHDCPNKYIRSIINLEHAIFEVGIEQASDAATFNKSYYGEYMSKLQWSKMLMAAGFTPKTKTIAFTKTIIRPYYQIMKRG